MQQEAIASNQLPLLTKHCFACGEEKVPEAFARCKARKDGLQSRCRKCWSEWHKEYLKRNPDKRAKRNRKARRDYWKNRGYYREENRAFREKNPTYAHDWYLANRDRVLESSRERQVRKKWGLTLAKYDAIIARGCAICGLKDDPERENKHVGKLCLDHDHANGKIRDALCSDCNLAIGNMKDDFKRLRAAADYLERHGK
jgi:hypothetical protein